MEISARNVLKGTVKNVVMGVVTAEVTLEIAPGTLVTGVISKASAERLGLKEGKEAHAIVKSSDVMFAVE